MALQEGIAMVLGTCFRLLANAKNTDSVTNTAAATVRQVRFLCCFKALCMLCTALVRLSVKKGTFTKSEHKIQAVHAAVSQAVALVFDHVLTGMDQSSSGPAAEAALPAVASEPGSAKASDIPRDSKSPRGHGTTNAALKLLDDLCMMATGDALAYAGSSLPCPVMSFFDLYRVHDVAMHGCQRFCVTVLTKLLKTNCSRKTRLASHSTS